jgi:tetratricopeptide (TPR) repeat protein
MLDWFSSREVNELGAALADEFASRSGTVARGAPPGKPPGALEQLLRRAETETRALRLNFYKKAKFLNSFKWRLIENGVARETADNVTESLLLHLSANNANTSRGGAAIPATEQRSPANRKQIFLRGNEAFAREAYEEAAACYQELLEFAPRDVDALHNLGAAFAKLSRLAEAERCLRQALDIKREHVQAHVTLGIVLRERGESAESEIWLRRALKLNPNHVVARTQHGASLLALGRLREARARFEKVLRTEPRHAEATLYMGEIALLEGRFEEAESLFRRALEFDPKMPSAWAALARTRKLTPSDDAWVKRAREIAASGISAVAEAELRFAIGKYCDDLNDFEEAFKSYQRANELAKKATDAYEREARACFVDDMTRIYTSEAISAARGEGASASIKPIFVIGMPRSGTSLAEQIIASHPAAKGAGELGFCPDSMLAQDSELRQGILTEATRKKLAMSYLSALEAAGGSAPRIVDKAAVNSDYLGAIYTVFPNARVVYMRRDPIDTCLSCYFQPFSAAMNFTVDLSDLAHYLKQHQRLMGHWHAVLPPGWILDVSYEELVADQEGWTRKILDFLGLAWDERCLDFHKTERPVVTASAWQVRQKIYKGSVARWRNYQKFIAPLLQLKD